MSIAGMPIAVIASGMVTAVGFNAASSCTAMRAGIDGLHQANLWDLESGDYLNAGRVHLPHWWIGIGKLAELAAPAIAECLSAAEPVETCDIPIILCLPSADRPHRMTSLDERIIQEIEHKLGFQLHPTSQIIAQGHVSIAHALQRAQEIIGKGQSSLCIIAAVDSLIQHDLKTYYLEKRRLLTPENSNGFILGEAGSALLIASAGDKKRAELRVLGIGMAREHATIESEDPLKGDGLTQAIGDAFSNAGVTIEDLHYRITDLNGEHYKFKEMAIAMMRYERKPKEKLFDLWHPIEYIGDVGAAIGPIVLGVALHASQKGYAIGPKVLCTFGNDNGHRAAIIVHYVPGENSAWA